MLSCLYRTQKLEKVLEILMEEIGKLEKSQSVLISMEKDMAVCCSFSLYNLSFLCLWHTTHCGTFEMWQVIPVTRLVPFWSMFYLWALRHTRRTRAWRSILTRSRKSKGNTLILLMVRGQRLSHLYSLSKPSEIICKLWLWAVQIKLDLTFVWVLKGPHCWLDSFLCLEPNTSYTVELYLFLRLNTAKNALLPLIDIDPTVNVGFGGMWSVFLHMTNWR